MFPNLDLTISASEGSAVVWYSSTNVMEPEHGQGRDHRSHHVACPVIAGNKWGALKIAVKLAQWNRIRCPRSKDEDIPPIGN